MIDTKQLWIVGQQLGAADSQAWHFQGVFDTKGAAIAACVNDHFFVGPVTLNEALPVFTVDSGRWWYPRLQPEPSLPAPSSQQTTLNSQPAVKISVTQKHIENGLRRCALRCALALAFESAGFIVMVEPASVSIYNDAGDFLGDLALPFDAQCFLIAFDNGQPVEPFSFEMPDLRLPVHESNFPKFASVPVT